MKIFYYCADHNRPIEGERQAYQHVNVLTAAGYESYALHPTNGFRLTWFRNDTPVMGPEEFRKTYDITCDFLVLPDDMGERIARFPGKKILFNQTIHKSFGPLGQKQDAPYPCLDESVKCIFTVSDFALRHFQFGYPGKRVLKVSRQIDLAAFSSIPLAEKKRVIAWVPRNLSIFHTAFHLVQSRARQGLNTMADFAWASLSDKTSQQVGEILRDALFFISSNVEEEPDLNFLGALLSGCVIAGYCNSAVRNNISPPSRLFEHADAPGLVQHLEGIAARFPGSVEESESLQRTQHEIAIQYSPEEQKRSVLAAWKQLIGSS